MEVNEEAILREEAVKLLRDMRICKFSNHPKGEFNKRYGHLFNQSITADIPHMGCKCHSYEKFNVHWRPDVQSVLETIIAMGHCSHMLVSGDGDTQKIGIYAIHMAAGLGDMDLLTAILDNGGNMYSTTLYEGLFPLDIAILNGHKVISEELLRRQFLYPNDEEIIKKKGRIITVRLYFNDTEGAELCIQAGASIDLPHWENLFCQAVEHSQISVVKWLLDTGIGDVNQRLRVGLTALHYARRADVAQMLLSYGADPTLITNSEGTPLMFQLKRRRLSVAECIVEYDPTVIDQVVDNSPYNESNHYSALQSCAYAGNLSGVQMLVRHGANHRLVTYDGNTPISLACFSDRQPCVEYLLSLGCDTNCQDKDGDTALIYATFNGNWTMVDTLLKHGADPSISNHSRITPLWNAVHCRSVETVKGLLSLNVDASKPCRGRNIFEDHNFNDIYDEAVTPLFVAIHHEDITIAKALVCVGCYLNREKFTCSNFDMYVEHWAPDNKKWLNHVSSNPHSLAWWCKRMIRSNLPLYPKAAVESLPIPSSLKAYIEDIGVP